MFRALVLWAALLTVTAAAVEFGHIEYDGDGSWIWFLGALLAAPVLWPWEFGIFQWIDGWYVAPLIAWVIVACAWMLGRARRKAA